MRRTVLLMAIAIALLFPAAAQAQHLPAHLKASHCSTLKLLHGVARDRHYLEDLCGKNHALYRRMYRTVWGESRWHPHEVNSSDHAGYAQFAAGWANGRNVGRWVWNRLNGVLNLRFFYYFVTHPRLTGGWANWAGH